MPRRRLQQEYDDDPSTREPPKRRTVDIQLDVDEINKFIGCPVRSYDHKAPKNTVMDFLAHTKQCDIVYDQTYINDQQEKKMSQQILNFIYSSSSTLLSSTSSNISLIVKRRNDISDAAEISPVIEDEELYDENGNEIPEFSPKFFAYIPVCVPKNNLQQIISFNKFSGMFLFKNAIVLFINIDNHESYTNLFAYQPLSNVESSTENNNDTNDNNNNNQLLGQFGCNFYAAAQLTEESPIIQAMIKAMNYSNTQNNDSNETIQNSASVAPNDNNNNTLNNSSTTPRDVNAPLPILLFVRLTKPFDCSLDVDDIASINDQNGDTSHVNNDNEDEDEDDIENRTFFPSGCPDIVNQYVYWGTVEPVKMIKSEKKPLLFLLRVKYLQYLLEQSISFHYQISMVDILQLKAKTSTKNSTQE